MKAIVSRFVSLFLAGGLGAMTTFFASGVTFHSVDDLQKVGSALLIAVIFGGIGAIEKYLTPPATPITTPVSTNLTPGATYSATATLGKVDSTPTNTDNISTDSTLQPPTV